MIEREIKSLKRWRKFSFVMFILIIVCFCVNTIVSIIYTPKREIVLLEKNMRLYQVGDLTKRSISNGQVRQMVFELLNQRFSFDHTSFITDEAYKKRFSGLIRKDMPDVRDAWRVWFTPKGFQDLMTGIKGMPFMRNFHTGGKWIRTTVATPPRSIGGDDVNNTVIGQINANTGRLEFMFTGNFYFESYSRRSRTERFLINYAVKLVRDDSVVSDSSQKHFFTPMIEHNFTGMKFDSITLTLGDSIK